MGPLWTGEGGDRGSEQISAELNGLVKKTLDCSVISVDKIGVSKTEVDKMGCRLAEFNRLYIN